MNDAKFDPARDPKIATHISDRKKIKVMDTSNGDLQQKSLINWTLLIITTMMDPQIDGRVATCGSSLNKITVPMTNGIHHRHLSQQRIGSPDS